MFREKCRKTGVQDSVLSPIVWLIYLPPGFRINDLLNTLFFAIKGLGVRNDVFPFLLALDE